MRRREQIRSSELRFYLIPLREEADPKEWLNCEAKVFTFESNDDEDAVMYEIPPKKKIAPEVESG